MRTFFVRFAYTAAALALAFVMLVLLASKQPSRDDVAARRMSSEVSRVRAHLGRVEAELRSADVSHLTLSQRSARARHIEVLRAYREVGVFPHNHVFNGRYSPVFVDEHGTQCAVGFLIAQSGRKDIVRRISSTRNYATVPQLADEPGLAEWLRDAGISLAEAARIQPAYGPIDPPQQHTTHDYATASIIATGLGGGMIAWNLLTDRSSDTRTLPGVMGLGVGLGAMLLGGIGFHQNGTEPREARNEHILINFSVGLVSSAFGIRTLIGQRTPPASSTGQQDARESLKWDVSPWRPADHDGAGLRLNLRF
jgi:hypothetical protein